MKKIIKSIAIFALLLIVLLGIAIIWATSKLSTDAPNIERPRYKSYELGDGAADGSSHPSEIGWMVDGAGRARILPPMPPEKPMDIHTAANYKKDLSLRSCFWPGPRARNGVFTNDANSFSFENQFPDTATTYIPTALQIPQGAKLVVKGEFPHMRHWNFNTYNTKGEPQDALNDVDIVADAGSLNPFYQALHETRQSAASRSTLSMENRVMPVRPIPSTPSPKPAKKFFCGCAITSLIAVPIT
jgi:hypothetical protein